MGEEGKEDGAGMGARRKEGEVEGEQQESGIVQAWKPHKKEV